MWGVFTLSGRPCCACGERKPWAISESTKPHVPYGDTPLARRGFVVGSVGCALSASALSQMASNPASEAAVAAFASRRSER
jgi:hypothetical protein